MRDFTRGNLKAAIHAVHSAKLRSFWTMLGVIIGVASVITVVSIGEGVKQQVSGQLHRYGKDLIFIQPARINAGGTSSSDVNVLSDLAISGFLSPKDATTVKHVKGVAATAPLTIASGEVNGENGPYKDGYVIGTTPDLSRLLNQSVSFGSFLTEDDMGVNSAVLGPHAADEMFNDTVPLGKTFTFRGQEFIVRGIFNEFHSTPLSQQANFDNAVFIPFDVANSLTKNTAPTYQILAKASSAKDTQQTASSIKQALDKTHGGQSNVSIAVGDQSLMANDSIIDSLTRLIAGVAAISLLVGGIGIMNVMLVSVTERMHEIGIRKALGATNTQILHQFLMESSVLSAVGGVIGILVALATNGLLRVYTDLRPVISWEVVIGATVVSLLVGIIFGTFPALKAARKDPIEALRSSNF